MGRILVIRGGAIGDFVLTLPALGLLREAFPEAHIELMGYKSIIALAEGRHYVDSTRSIEYAAMASFFNPKSKLAPDLIEYFQSFDQIVSYLFDPDGFFEFNLNRCKVKNFIVGNPKITGPDHACIQLAEPLQKLALFLDQPAARLYPNREDVSRAEAMLQGREQAIAFHPGSGSPLKNWPPDQWRELLDELGGEYPKAHFIMIAGEADGEAVSSLDGSISEERWQSVIDRPLTDVAAVIARCQVYIGHDTGISHIAAATGTESVLLFGPTDPKVWAPQNPNAKIIEAESCKLEDIPISRVLEEIDGLIG